MLAADSKPTSLSYVDRFPDGEFTIIDVRPDAQCQRQSLKNAICIPQEHITTPVARLANVSGLLWLLGTAGLDGSEHVVVVGDKAVRRDFIAGVLHLAGQVQVYILNTSVNSLMDSGQPTAVGRSRSNVRLKVFKSRMRSDKILLRNELMPLLGSMQAPTILDGRTEAEYWGHLILGTRGGHLPGAVHSPISSWKEISPPNRCKVFSRKSSGLRA